MADKRATLNVLEAAIFAQGDSVRDRQTSSLCTNIPIPIPPCIYMHLHTLT